MHEQLAKFYMSQLFSALAHIHENGLFHRDVKPENILISGNSIKLADFGCCELIGPAPHLVGTSILLTILNRNMFQHDGTDLLRFC